MSNPNFVSELVQMARAFEELPGVKQELDAERTKHIEAMNNIQRLELRLIDSANELAEAREATRKAEVERDHAETMFLETDQKLDTLRGIITRFQGDVDGYLKASEPEPVAEPEPVPAVVPEGQDIPSWAGPEAQPSPATPATSTDTASSSTSPEGDGLSGPTGESAADPTVSAQSGETGPHASLTTANENENASQPAMTSSSSSSSEPTPQDDVGYHNEPESGEQDWYHRWSAWSDRMNARYGIGSWPTRSAIA